ncbi:MAG: hypothetical protein JWQ07_3620 [Ramlibacter sp.]|nr:hypothetical protein [Ramlibacter sp.]
MPPSLDHLNLLTHEQLARWRGLPVNWVRTPEGAWGHSFTPPTTSLALLDTGTLTTRMSMRGRSADMDASAGAFALFDAGVEVKVSQTGARHARRILLDLDLGDMLRRRLFDDDIVTMALRAGADFRDDALAPVLREMVREIRAGCPNGALFAESLSVGVAVHLRRTRGLRPAPTERGKLSTAQWARLNELIASELASDLSLSAMAAAVGLSKPHFVRLFRNTAGTSPHRYVVLKRIERARQLLRSTQDSLVDIALEAGFASQSHLTRTFREVVGVTPGDLRKQLAGKILQ